MLKFTIKRVLYSILILFFVMFLIYILMYNMPMGYIETKARELASRPGATKSYAEWLADLNAQYGMDKGGRAGISDLAEERVQRQLGGQLGLDDSGYGRIPQHSLVQLHSGIRFFHI